MAGERDLQVPMIFLEHVFTLAQRFALIILNFPLLEEGPIQTTFIHSFLQWTQILKAYYDEKNVVYIQAEGAFKDEILSMLPKLFEDSELVQMVSNFIEEVPTVFYLDSTFIISTEYLIACLIDRQAGIGDKGNSLFLSDELQRSTVLKLERIKEEISPRQVSFREIPHFTNEEIIKPYLDNSFFLLVKLMKDRLHLVEDVQAVFLTYVFLYKLVIRHFSQKWASEYNEYFRNIDDLSLPEAIQQYCLIETINPNNLQTAGTFIYYLIDHGKFGGDNYLLCVNLFVLEAEMDMIRQQEDNYLLCLNLFVQQLNAILERQKTESFAHKIKRSSVNRAYTINESTAKTSG